MHHYTSTMHSLGGTGLAGFEWWRSCFCFILNLYRLYGNSEWLRHTQIYYEWPSIDLYTVYILSMHSLLSWDLSKTQNQENWQGWFYWSKLKPGLGLGPHTSCWILTGLFQQKSKTQRFHERERTVEMSRRHWELELINSTPTVFPPVFSRGKEEVLLEIIISLIWCSVLASPASVLFPVAAQR